MANRNVKSLGVGEVSKDSCGGHCRSSVLHVAANIAAAIVLEAGQMEGQKEEAARVARIAVTTIDILVKELFGDSGLEELVAEYQNFMRNDYTQ